MKTKTEIHWPSIEEQKQYWIDKEAESDNAAGETLVEKDERIFQCYRRITELETKLNALL